MRFRIRTKIIAALLFPVLLFLSVVGVVTLYNINTIQEASLRVEVISKERTSISNLMLLMGRAFMSANDYIITGNREYIEIFYQMSDKVETGINELERAVRLADEMRFAGREGVQEVLSGVKLAWENIKGLAGRVFTVSDPVGDKETARLMEEIDYRWAYPVLDLLRGWHEADAAQYRAALRFAESTWRRSLVIMAAAAFLLAISGLSIAAFYASVFARPVEVMSRRARAIAKGDFSKTVSIRTGDEFEVLSDAINEMSSELNSLYSDMEGQIREKTVDIKEREEWLNRITNAANDAIICIKPPETITLWNKKAEEMFGYSAEEATGKEIHKLIVPERFHEGAYEGLASFFRTGAGPIIGRAVELSAMRRDGAEFPVEVSISSVNIKGGWYAVGIVRDITERKRAESALLDSERRYKHLLGSVTDYVYTVFIEDNRPVKTLHGPGCEAVTGYSPDEYEANKKLWYQMVPKEDREYVLEQASKVLTMQAAEPIEHRIVHKDGRMRWIRNTVVARYNEEGRLVAYDGLISDITERKQAEVLLKESEGKYRRLIENLRTRYIFYSHGIDGVFTYLSPSITNVLGYTQEEFFTHYAEYFTDNPINKDAISHTALSIKGISQPPYQIEIFHKDRSTRWLEVTEVPLFDTKGKVVAVEGIACDITIRKISEEMLVHSKKEWEATFDAISLPLFIHDREFKIVRANRAYRNASGMGFSEFIGRPYYEVFPKTDGPFKMCKTAMELQEEEEEEEEEFSCPATKRIFKIKFYPIKDDKGKYLYSIHFLEDITEAKRAEEGIREAVERYYTLFEDSPAGIMIIDPETALPIEFNDTACQQLGYSREEFSRMRISDYEAAETPEETKAHMEKILKEGRDTFQARHRTKNGDIRDVLVYVRSINLSGKKVFHTVCRDITDLKRSEERIRQEMETTTQLLTIADATAQTTDIDRLMEQVIQCGHKIINCNICLSYLWDREIQRFTPAQQHGLPNRLITAFRTEPLEGEKWFVKKALMKRRPMVIHHEIRKTGDEEAVSAPLFSWLPDAETLTVIPLLGRRGYLGVIIGIYSERREFGEREMKVMRGISDQVSTALEQARLYRDSTERAMELSRKIEIIQVMHEIDRSILSTLEQQEILDISTRLISRVMPCDRAAVALLDREKKGFVYAATFGTEPAKGTFISFDDTNMTEVVRTGMPQYISNLAEIKELPRLETDLLDGKFLSYVRVPLTVRNEITGVLSIASKRPSAFTKEDLSALEKISTQISVALENARLVSDLDALLIGTIKALSSAIDAKSRWTAGHSERVTKYAVSIAREMGFDEMALREIELAGLLHDIGKIGTYETILDKAGALTEEELKLIRQHPLKGVEILTPIKQLKGIIPAVRHHHEYYNGNGYPDGIKGESIPVFARVLAVADSVDAMGADRPYRKGRSMDAIIEELKKCSGTQFDKEVVEAFLKTEYSRPGIKGVERSSGSAL